MKTKFYLFFISLFFLNQSGIGQDNNNEILLTIGEREITKAEFVRIYKKNNTGEGPIDVTSLKEYLELFINFKLKVIEAESLGYDTVASFKKELAGYRKQLVKPYLTDKQVDEDLLKEAYDRFQTDIKASHILIKADKNASSKDTLKAFNEAMKARKRILAGEVFEEVAKDVSQDVSVERNGGNLGYFTVFQMVYAFETAAYNMAIGEISMPVRSKHGYHIIKVFDKRDASGQVKVAHIMIAVPKGSKPEKAANAKDTIYHIHELIKQGDDFAKLAKQYSDDKGSAAKGGELPWFGTGRMIPEFEHAAFDLKEKGDVSDPVQTSYGFHIIKLLDKKPIGTFKEEAPKLKSKISRDSRAHLSKKSIVGILKKEYNYTCNKKNLSDFYKVVTDSVFFGKWKPESAKHLNKTLFSFADTTVPQSVFTGYLDKFNRKSPVTSIKKFVDQAYERLVERMLLEYEEGRLEEKYTEFRYLMNEYHDGILLFELTDKLVWTKAVEDTTGLEEYHAKHKEKYVWGKRLDATVFKYNNDDVAKKAQKVMSKRKAKGYSDNDILSIVNKKDSTGLKLIEAKIYTKGHNDDVDLVFDVTEPTSKVLSKKKLIIDIKKILKPQPKTLRESRGLVTADYQTYLEKEWIRELKKKYKVTVDEKMLSTIK